MSFLALLGPGLFSLTSLVIGSRLVMRRGEDRLPALLIGVAFLGGGGFGQPLVVLGHALERQGSVLAFPVQAIALVSLDIGATALWAFTWQVFRPTLSWARTLVVLAVLGLTISLIGQFASTRLFSLLDGSNPWFWLGFGVRASSAGWAAFESLRYGDMMRRRLSLGLSDPLTTHRFLLWGMSASAIVLFYVIAAVSLAVGGPEIATSGPVVALGSFLGIEAAASMWLAFFPPGFYRARFEPARRAGGTEQEPR